MVKLTTNAKVNLVFQSLSILGLAWVTGCNAPARSNITGCSGSDPAAYGKMKINLKGDRVSHSAISAAKIRVLDVQIKSTSGGWYRFQVNPFDLNLLNPGASLNQIIAQGSSSLGIAFDEVRLITEDFGSAAFNDGRTVALRIPSGSHSGLKVHFNQVIDLRDGLTTVSNITFDTEKSFVIPGHQSEVLFSPVVTTSVSFSALPTEESSTEDNGSSTDTSSSTDFPLIIGVGV